MDLGLKGKVALVTGAARGIGAAVALALAREGCDVAPLDRADDAGLAGVADGVRRAGRTACPLVADVRDFGRAEEAVAEALDALGGLDLLVLNAGVARDRIVWKMDEEAWDEVLAVNLKGAFNYARAAAPALRERGGGRVVLVSSINGLRGKLGQANYAASKAGVIGLAKTLARELGRSGTTVNVVAPGMVRTDMTRTLPAEVVEAAVGETVLGRIAEPEDVAGVVVLLCSRQARHVTGQVVAVDGGQRL